MSIIKKDSKAEIIIPQDKLEYLQKELTNVREEFADNKYVREAITVLAAGGLRSTIGSYWNAVVDDLRRKIMHRSIDLFNKEINPKKEIKTYEDFQNHLTDFELIDGAYKIGVLSWEAHKLLHQARETRNIFDGHPDSSDPTLFKVFNMIADCNRYVLSQDYPLTIIDVNQYILTMDTDTFNKNEIAVEQAFTDLPEIYKNEMTNRLFTLYIGDNASTRLKSNIEFSYPVLWKVISKEIRQQIGKRFDKLMVEGNSETIEKANDLLTIVEGLRYVSAASRKILYEPAIKDLEENLDNWGAEGRAVQYLQRLGTNIPTDFIGRYVSALTLTYVGYKGGSFQYSRTEFYSNSAAPRISDMFEKFDNSSAEAFIETIKTNEKLQQRIRYTNQLNRLRTLGNILLNKPEIRDDTREFLEVLVDPEKTKEFFISLKGK
ncbi:hypothetical protein [Pleomorphovibrio marinus]|uniref:hypothetical protein n=1 Tax=Pleomorphovibrio marinus TaxID=2164132 RepID=UPI000E0C593F|nr:hypothetical protein [Pleomorphovibrio marinus]